MRQVQFADSRFSSVRYKARPKKERLASCMLSILNDEARWHVRALDKVNFTTSLKSDHAVTPESERPKWHRDVHSGNAAWSLPLPSHQLWHCLKNPLPRKRSVNHSRAAGLPGGLVRSHRPAAMARQREERSTTPTSLLPGSSTSSGTSTAPVPWVVGLPSLHFHLPTLEKTSCQVKSKCVRTPQLPLWAAPSLHALKC